MKYEKPEMELIVFRENVHMTLSLVPGGVGEGEGDMKVDDSDEVGW